jgi:hypothetical protein
MINAGTAFARAASQPSVSGDRDFCIAAHTSLSHLTIKQNLAVGRSNRSQEKKLVAATTQDYQ